MDLMSVLQQQISGDVLRQLSEKLGASEEQTSQASNGVFAAILGGLAGNASSAGGLESLMSALDRDHDGSVLDDLLGFVTGDATMPAGAANGTGILGHILGDKQDEVARRISGSTGLDADQIRKLMPMLAPIAMGVLGKARKGAASGGGADVLGGGIFDLARTLLGSAKSASGQNGLGDLVGSLIGGVIEQQVKPSKGRKKQGTAGGLLGMLFDKLLKK